MSSPHWPRWDMGHVQATVVVLSNDLLLWNQSWNQLDWKRPSRSSSSTITPGPESLPLNHVTAHSGAKETFQQHTGAMEMLQQHTLGLWRSQDGHPPKTLILGPLILAVQPWFRAGLWLCRATKVALAMGTHH